MELSFFRVVYWLKLRRSLPKTTKNLNLKNPFTQRRKLSSLSFEGNLAAIYAS